MVYIFVSKKAGGKWTATSKAPEGKDLTAEADSPLALEAAVKEVVGTDSGHTDGFSVQHSAVSPTSTVIVVNLGRPAIGGAPASGGAAPAADAGAAAAPAEEKKPEPEPEEEEEDGDMFDLFG
eukprot:m.476539 g.476539  ORF g.476539 m.476539 type:complete len:123 (+) comp20555_c0_seq1:243-611(+)